jgi:hypothetical protein
MISLRTREKQKEIKKEKTEKQYLIRPKIIITVFTNEKMYENEKYVGTYVLYDKVMGKCGRYANVCLNKSFFKRKVFCMTQTETTEILV